MKDAYLSLGSNIGEPLKNLSEAVVALGKIPSAELCDVSSFYKTAPVGFLQQNDFVNICVKLQTEMPPEMLLGCCLGIEAAMGRSRPFKNSPRIIDIDLILYGADCCNTSFLTLPHPRFAERAFVLRPLYEIAADEVKRAYKLDELLAQTALQRAEKLTSSRIGIIKA